MNSIMAPTKISYDVPKDKQYVSLPFWGHQSYIIRNKLLALFKSSFPHIDVKVVLTNRNTIGSYFRVKERLTPELCPNVIYHYKCSSGGCTSSYVGSTERTLHDRRCEHEGISFRTHMKLTVPTFSAIREHCIECSHPFSAESFKIVGRGHRGDDLKLLESVFIKYLKPNLNLTESAKPLYIT